MEDRTNKPEYSGEALAGAFATLMGGAKPSEPSLSLAAPPVAPEAEPAPPVATDQSGEPGEAPAQQESVGAESQELVALRQDFEAKLQEAEQREARAANSLNWARQGFLRKSDEAAKAKELLRKAAAAGELDKEELERFLASGPSAQPQGGIPQAPQPYQSVYQPAPYQPEPDERLVHDTNQFLADYRMGEKDASDFTKWIGSGPTNVTDRDNVPGNHYATLRLLHERWQEAKGADPVVAQAAASLARTQREVAKAAGSQVGRTAPPPTPPPTDVSKLSVEDRVKQGLVAEWWKQSMANIRGDY